MNEPTMNGRQTDERCAVKDGAQSAFGCSHGPGGEDVAATALAAVVAGARGLARSDFLGLETRLRLIAGLIDEASGVIDNSLGPFATAPQRVPSRTDPVVCGARDVFGAILEAYQSCTELCERSGADEFVQRDCDVRLIRVAAERVKWERFACGPAHLQLWQWVGAALRRSGLAPAAEARPLGAIGCGEDAPIEREYLRLVAVFSAGYDQLEPDGLEVVSGLLDVLLPTLELHTQPVIGATCHLDIRVGTPPSRLVRPLVVSDAIRYLSTQRAWASLQSFSTQLARGVVPAELAHLPDFRDSLRRGVAHLLRQWSAAPPSRQYRRHAVAGDLVAVRGVDEVNSVISDRSSPNSGVVWRLSDVSRGGVGALAPAASAAQPDVGELIALRPSQGDVWHLGVVRRIWHESDEVLRLGVQTLSTSPYVARADDGRARADVLVCDVLQRGEAIRLVVPAGRFSFGTPLFLSNNGALHKLRALDLHPLGESLDLWVYQVL